MKYVTAFAAAFILVAAIVLVWRFSGSDDVPPGANNTVAGDAGTANKPTPAKDYESHGGKADEEEGGEARVDLKNTHDPVTGAEVGDVHEAHAHTVHQGHLIHFADAKSLAAFKLNPMMYLNKLELEPFADGSVKKVDASTHTTPPLPEECPFCGMLLDADSDNYILHRNFKIFFG